MSEAKTLSAEFAPAVLPKYSLEVEVDGSGAASLRTGRYTLTLISGIGRRERIRSEAFWLR